MENRLNVEYIPVGKLKPYDKNTRKHEDYDVSQIAKSIEQYGFNDPIGIWGKDNIIVEGHGRLLAAKKLGMAEVPCIRLDDLTDEKRREYAIMHNKTAELSTWDFDLLAAEIDGLEFSGFDIDWGLPTDEEETEITEDEPPEVDDEHEPICQLGDIWQLGRHKLICGDSTDKATVERLMDGKEADTILVDPPYDQEELYEVIPEKETEKKLIVSYDHKHFVKPIMEATLKGWIGRYEFIWDCQQSWYTPNRPLARHKTFTVFMDKPDWNFENAIVYDGKERKPQQGYNTRGYYDYKPLDGAVHLRTVEQFSNTAMHEDCNQGKPVRWVGAILAGVNAEIVLDLFGGSGSTLIACEQLNRVCYMCEIDPKYCDVILKRYENLTGKKAVKIS